MKLTPAKVAQLSWSAATPHHSPPCPTPNVSKDVAIVRQLFENFIDASREVVPRLALLHQSGSPSLSGLPTDWTKEHAPRLFKPPGKMNGFVHAVRSESKGLNCRVRAILHG